MIRGLHAMFYTSEAEALRAFFKENLRFAAHDVGDGWLIFDMPEADLGCHPADATLTHGAPTGTHAISFDCDDIQTSKNYASKASITMLYFFSGYRYNPLIIFGGLIHQRKVKCGSTAINKPLLVLYLSL